MNLQLEHVTTLLQNGCKMCFDSMFVKGAHIRFVEIPENVNVTASLDHQVKKNISTRRYNERFSSKINFRKKKLVPK